LSWTISGVDRSKTYSFALQALALQAVSPTDLEAYSNFRQVTGGVLTPLGKKMTVSMTCTLLSATGLPDSEAPCMFSTAFSFNSSAFKAGTTVVLQVEWSSGGTSHQLYSSPISIGGSSPAIGASSTGLGRRLEAAPVTSAAAEPRRLWSQEAWNARIQANSASCNERNLKFNFGTGLLMRGKVDGINVPAGFPMIGGSAEQPGLTTGFRTIFKETPGEEAADALGGPDSILCQAGLCQGELPGCSEGGPNKMNFPKLVFDFNRPYYFSNNSQGAFNGMMKQALAYAFSTLPEMVDVIIMQVNKSGMPFAKKPPTTTPASTNWWDNQPAPTPAPTVEWPTQPIGTAPAPATSAAVLAGPAPTQAPRSDEGLTDAFNKWWNGAGSRRLSAASRPLSVAGDAEALPEELASHQARLEFRRGVHFIIDRQLVEMMLQHGYFNTLEDVEDEHYKVHGPLRITRFFVDSGLHSTSARERTEAGAGARAPSLATGFAMLGAAVGASSLAAFAVLRCHSRPTKGPYSSSLGAEPEGLE